MNPPSEPIEAALRDHVDHRQFTTPPVDAILTRGRRLRRRRAVLSAAAGVAAVALVGGLGWTVAQSDGGGAAPAGAPKPAASAHGEPSQLTDIPTGTPNQSPPAGVALTPCFEIPRITDPGSIDDFTVDAENGILTFTFPTTQGERTVDIAYERDRACRRHPDVRELIKRVEGASG